MGALDELPRRRMQFKGLVNIWESKVEEGTWAKSAHGHGSGRDVGGCASTLSPVANEISHALARLQVSRGDPTKSPSQTSSKCATTTKPIVRKRKDLATTTTTVTVDPPSCTPTTPDTTLPSSRKRHCETLSQKRKEKKRRPEKKVEEEELEEQENERRTGGEYDPRSGTLRINGIELETTEAFETFWKYTAERQVVENKRRLGLSPP